MSAFGFINNTSPTRNNKSPLLSSSLIEDMYDSQHLNTFVNQSRTSSPRSQSSFRLPAKKPKPVSSYFSFIDDIDSTNKHSSNSSESYLPLYNKKQSSEASSSPDILKKSAFAFIANTPKKADLASSKVEHYSPKTEYPSPRISNIKPNNEMKLVSATASLQRIQTEKSNELNKLERLYKKQLQIFDQISTLKSKISLVQQQKLDALSIEDFLAAETLQTQEQKMSNSLSELMSQISIEQQIQTSWKKVNEIQEKESKSSQQVIDFSEQVKQERHLHYMKFITDNEKIHQQKLKEIDEQRNEIESEKSEIAFDFGLWEQSQEDLLERVDDAIHEEVIIKKDLEDQTHHIQNEIRELQEKLKSLEIRKSELLASTVEIDLAMEEKLKPFENEKLEQEQEYETIDIRKKEVEVKAFHLNELESKVDTEMNRHFEEKERGLEEIRALDQRIILATDITQHVESSRLLNQVLNKIQTRDELVTQHKSQMKKLQEDIQVKKKLIDSSRHIVYDKNQKGIHLDETILEMQQKLKSLGRHKQLAIDAGRFQNAAAWSNQIKLMEKELAKQTLDQQQQQTDTHADEEHLNKEKQELHALEEQYIELEKEKNAEIKLILEKFKEELLDIKTNDDKVIDFMIQHELESLSNGLQVLYQHDLVSLS